MFPDIGIIGGSSRRPMAFVLALAVTATLCFGLSALRPSTAKAWAWKDTCTLFVFNKTGSQGSVRPILYTPLLPNAASLAEYATFAAIGIPTSGAAAFTNTGFPVPSYGCHAFMNFANPGPTVSCKVSAPTTGANTFSCEGNATTKIIQDNDDIAGNVFIPSGSGAATPEPTQPSTGPAAVQTAALPGAGWQRSQKIARFGLVGDLMNSDQLPAGCESSGDPATAKVVSSEELVRDGGSQDVGAVVSTYGSAAQSTRNVTEALSQHSIDCLARLLTSTRLHTRVAVKPLAAGARANGMSGARLVISQRVNGHVREVDYLDVDGRERGDRDGIEMLESARTPLATAAEGSELGAVRLGG